MSDESADESDQIGLESPPEAEADDYLRIIEGGETGLNVYAKDDKEWWS